MFYPIAKQLKTAVLFSLISGLAACANLNPAQQQEPQAERTAPEPPELSTTIELDLDTKPAVDDAAQTPPAAATAPARINDALLPGLQKSNAAAVEQRYESSLQTRQKRVYLGLDRERENQPVNNIVDWEF